MSNKIGRPTKYKSEMCDVVIELMREGASQEEVCGHLDISRETFYRWREENKDFSDTVKRGIGLSQAWWEKEGRISLRDSKFNYTGWYMNMKNRFKWADKQEVKAQGDITVLIDTGITRSPGQDEKDDWLNDD